MTQTLIPQAEEQIADARWVKKIAVARAAEQYFSFCKGCTGGKVLSDKL